MFIELTDHLRCPADHDEHFLVLIPDAMNGRDVVRGSLGCPVCQRTYPIDQGVASFGSAGPETAPTQLDPDAQAALAGLGGPGGYVVLLGGAAQHADQFAEHLPNVALVLMNAPAASPAVTLGSRLVGPRLPLKSGSMRAALLGPDYGDDPAWVAEAARVVLPGNRVVGEGSPPSLPALELAASAAGCWVATKVNRRS